MRQPHEPDFSERSIRYHVLRARLSRMVFAARLATSLRLSPALSPAFAATKEQTPLGPKSAHSHVCLAHIALDLSGRALRPNTSRAHRSDHFCLQFDYDL